MVQSPDKERKKRLESRKIELERRAREIKYWMQRDSKRVEHLRKLWEQRDQEYFSEARRVFEYICPICNRPFTSPRKLPAQNPKRCYTCTAFIRRKAVRDHYARNADTIRQKVRSYKQKKREACDQLVPNQTPQTGATPYVVWEPQPEQS